MSEIAPKVARWVGVALMGALAGSCASRGDASARPADTETAKAGARPQSCFLLYERGVGEIRRSPAAICANRVTPVSTFKIPHALAALDSGVPSGADVVFRYDGAPAWAATWKRDHTLATAIRYSVVWYFQRLATMLGSGRERDYLARFGYGNQDISSGLTTFWLDESLQISPDEQLKFLVRLQEDALPVSKDAMRVVREILVQPDGAVVNALGEHSFAAPWPAGTVVAAKTGRGQDVAWLIGHVSRGERSWAFVTCVLGSSQADPLAAIDLAARSLRSAGVL